MSFLVEKKHAYVLSAIIVVLIGARAVVSYNVNPGVVPDPGHALGKIQGYFENDANLEESLGKFCQSDGGNCKTVFLAPDEFHSADVTIYKSSPTDDQLSGSYDFDLANLKSILGENRDIEALIIQLSHRLGSKPEYNDRHVYLSVREDENIPLADDEYYFIQHHYAYNYLKISGQPKFAGMFYAWDRDGDGQIEFRLILTAYGSLLAVNDNVNLKVIGYVTG